MTRISTDVAIDPYQGYNLGMFIQNSFEKWNNSPPYTLIDNSSNT